MVKNQTLGKNVVGRLLGVAAVAAVSATVAISWQAPEAQAAPKSWSDCAAAAGALLGSAAMVPEAPYVGIPTMVLTSPAFINQCKEQYPELFVPKQKDDGEGGGGGGGGGSW